MRFLIRLANLHWCSNCYRVHWNHCIWCHRYDCGDCTCDYPFRWPARRRR